MMLKMPTIEERESEHDNVEELERKKKEYLNKVSRLNNEVDTLKQDLTKMQKQNEEHKVKLVKKEAREMLKERE